MALTAFEATDEDVQAVLRNRLGLVMTLDEAETYLAKLDLEGIQKAALEADDIDEQTQCAYDAIEEQLREALSMHRR